MALNNHGKNWRGNSERMPEAGRQAASGQALEVSTRAGSSQRGKATPELKYRLKFQGLGRQKRAVNSYAECQPYDCTRDDH